MFMDDHSVAQIAPSGDFGNTNSSTATTRCFPRSSGDLSRRVDRPAVAAIHATAIPSTANGVVEAALYNGSLHRLRRNVEGGGRRDDLQHTAYRIVGGVRGDLHRGLSYDASYQYGRTTLSQIYLNDFSVTRLGRALDVVADPVAG